MRLSDELKEHLWKMTSGHPGAVRALLNILKNHAVIRPFRKGHKIVPLDVGLEILEDITKLDDSLLVSVFSRSWPKLVYIQEDPALALYLEQVVATGGLRAKQQNKREQDICQRRGWLHTEVLTVRLRHNHVGKEAVYIFPKPLHHRLLENYFTVHDFPINLFGSVKELVMASLKFFQRINLSQTRVRTGGLAVEAGYQDELYRACWELLGKKLHLTSEYSPPGYSGRIDFFVQSSKWGIELVRNGDRLKGHIEQFLSNGRYHPWILKGLMKEYILVDFRITTPTSFNRKLNTYSSV